MKSAQLASLAPQCEPHPRCNKSVRETESMQPNSWLVRLGSLKTFMLISHLDLVVWGRVLEAVRMTAPVERRRLRWSLQTTALSQIRPSGDEVPLDFTRTASIGAFTESRPLSSRIPDAVGASGLLLVGAAIVAALKRRTTHDEHDQRGRQCCTHQRMR